MFARIWQSHFNGRIGVAWCSLMHESTRWPIHARYACGVCGRRYRVPWAETEAAGAGRVRRPALPKLFSTILPALALIGVLTWPAHAAEFASANDSAAAAAVLERFVAGQAVDASWPVETIDIEASLPQLRKSGSLKAIRTLAAEGDPDYKVLEIGGDPTVDRQVISRYVSAEERAAKFPASSVAVTPANYKIHYVGTLRYGSRLAYSFRIVPRRKRENLINGVIWLDSETGIALREFGCLAKSPSIFVKRIDLTRENNLDNGRIAARITHVAIEMRLIGKAQLVIVEQPSSDGLTAGPVSGQGQ